MMKLKYLVTMAIMKFLATKFCADSKWILYLLVCKKDFQLNIFHLQREIKKKRFNEQKISSYMNRQTSLLISKDRLFTIEYMYFLILGYSVSNNPFVNGVMILNTHLMASHLTL